MRGTQAHQPFGRLARQQAPFRKFDAVVHGIAQQVGQWRFKLFQHITVDLGLFPLHHQPYRLAQRAAEVSDHATLPGQYIGEWPHAAGQRRVVQQLCTLTGLPAELIEVGGLLLQDLLGLHQQALGLRQGFEHFTVLAAVFQLHAHAVERLHPLAVHAFEALQGGQVRLQALGLHQRLAGQVEQAVQAVGSDP